MTDGAIPSRVWWRSGYLWLMIAFTLAAFVGGGVTLYLAMQTPVEPPVQGQVLEQEGALEPALQARNRTSSRNARAMGTARESAPSPSGR